MGASSSSSSSSKPGADDVINDGVSAPRKHFRSLARYVGFLGSRRPISAPAITPEDEKEVIIFRFSKDKNDDKNKNNNNDQATVNDNGRENGKQNLHIVSFYKYTLFWAEPRKEIEITNKLTKMCLKYGRLSVWLAYKPRAYYLGIKKRLKIGHS